MRDKTQIIMAGIFSTPFLALEYYHFFKNDIGYVMVSIILFLVMLMPSVLNLGKKKEEMA